MRDKIFVYGMFKLFVLFDCTIESRTLIKRLIKFHVQK